MNGMKPYWDSLVKRIVQSTLLTPLCKKEAQKQLDLSLLNH